MNAFWQYQCDFGHHWSIYRPADAVELPGDTVCPQGHEAVTCRILPHADRTRITLLPATLIVDSVTGQVGDEDRYFVLIARVDGSEERMSRRHYGWSEAQRVAERFRNREFAGSLRL
jgi:hypothetical protein